VDEPPGGFDPRTALLFLTEPDLGDAFDRLSQNNFKTWSKVGYRRLRHRGTAPLPTLEPRSTSEPTASERDAIVASTRNPAFRKARRDRNRSGQALVRDLLQRLAEGTVVSFGTPSTAEPITRFEIDPSVWTDAKIKDFPFSGRGWDILIGNVCFGQLTFHDRSILQEWRGRLSVARALELLFPAEFATYRRAKNNQRDLARQDPGAAEIDPIDHDLIHWDLVEIFRRGGFDFLVLYLPGPDAQFCPISSVQRNTYGLTEINIDRSMARLPGIDWLPALVRFVGSSAPGLDGQYAKLGASLYSDVRKVVDFLIEQSGLGPKAMSKNPYFELAKSRIPRLTEANFFRGWDAFAENNPDWKKAGRLKSNRLTK